MAIPSFNLPDLGELRETEDVEILDTLTKLVDLVSGQLDGTNILDGSLTSAELAAAAVTAAKLADAAVTDAKVAAAANIALSKLAVPPAARVYNDANISVPNNANTVLTFNQERFDTGGIHSTGTFPARLTCVTAGLYVISAHIQFAAGGSNYYPALHLRLNGATFIASQRTFSDGALTVGISLTTLYSLGAGDYVEALAFQNVGGALNVSAVGNVTPEFSMHYVGRAS